MRFAIWLTLCLGVLVIPKYQVFAEVPQGTKAGNYSIQQIAQAIYKAEGGAKARYAYGIRSVHYKDKAEARRICERTIRHALRDWNGNGDFIDFLSKRYCPIGCDNDRGTNCYWLKNVHYFLERGVK